MGLDVWITSKIYFSFLKKIYCDNFINDNPTLLYILALFL